jgi:hypothetical protein
MNPRIAFLTGQSDPGRCALSPAQRATLDTLVPHAAGIELHPCNFPWDTNTAPWRAVPLLRASLANGRQYLAARRAGTHALPDAAHDVARTRLLAAPRTLLLVGSCGLALLDALVAPFDAGQRTRLRAVSYGGVAPHWPAGIDGAQLRGRRDRIAAWLGPVDGPSPQTVDHGHMDYLDGDAVAQAARAHLDWLREGA